MIQQELNSDGTLGGSSVEGKERDFGCTRVFRRTRYLMNWEWEVIEKGSS